MSATSSSSAGDTQRLIDLRLDAIDRALLGLLPRSERQEMVAQIETRLRELGPAIAAGEAERAADIEHSSLDAGLPAGSSADAELASAVKRSRLAGRMNLSRRRSRSRLALASGVSGIVALSLLVLFPITYVLCGVLEPSASILIPVLGTHVTGLALGGLLAVVLGVAALIVLNRRDARLIGHGWAITGLCTGPLPMLIGGLIVLVASSQFMTAAPGIVMSPVSASSTSCYPTTVPAPGFPTPVEESQFASGSPYSVAPAPAYTWTPEPENSPASKAPPPYDSPTSAPSPAAYPAAAEAPPARIATTQAERVPLDAPPGDADRPASKDASGADSAKEGSADEPASIEPPPAEPGAVTGPDATEPAPKATEPAPEPAAPKTPVE